MIFVLEEPGFPVIELRRRNVITGKRDRKKEMHMGLFEHFRKKEKSIWDKAHEAKPQAYSKEGEEPFIVFTLTEDTDTILPVDPKKMYKIDGKEVYDFRLGLFSLTEDRIIGTLPYDVCVRFLLEYVKEKREPEVLIRGLHHDELTKLFKDAYEAQKERDLFQQAFEKNLKFIGREKMDPDTVERVFHGNGIQTFTFENILFPSGILIAADPICYLQDEKSVSCLKREITPGNYSILIAVLPSEKYGIRITGMKLILNERPSCRYELAEAYRLENGERKDTFAGYPVDTGTASFTDALCAKAYWKFLDQWYAEHPDGNLYDDYLADLFAKSYKEHPHLQRPGGDFIRMTIPQSEYEIVMAATGFGDGFYSVYWGLDEKDEVTELVTLFLDPQLFETKQISAKKGGETL